MSRSKTGRDAPVEVWWSTLVAADTALLDLLDRTERARVDGLQRPADAARSLLGAALLRVAVGEHLGVPAPDVAVDRTCDECGGPHGRPRVTGPGGPGPHVSVSHSGVLVVVALSPDAPVGVDVQRIADLDRLPGEPVEPRADEWVRREARLKAGAGSVQPAVRPLAAPVEGYAAALATLTPRPLADAELIVRHWPGASRAPGTGVDPGRGG